MTDAERTYASLAGAAYLVDGATMDYQPLLTITQEDIDALGVEGAPQEGIMTVAELKEKGCYKAQRSKGDQADERAVERVHRRPRGQSADTTSTGKFEIYCPTLAAIVNSLGYSQISTDRQVADRRPGAGPGHADR